MDDLLNEFLAETVEALELLDSELVELEQRPADPALLGSIFRIMHTIKGTCGFLGLPRLEAVAHAAEDVLGKVRDGELSVSADAVSLVLAALDRIKELIAELAVAGQEPDGGDDDVIMSLRDMAAGKWTAAEPVVEVAEEPANLPSIDGLYQRIGGASLFDTACEQACAEMLSAVSDHPDAETELLHLQFALAGAFAGALTGSSDTTADIDGVIAGLVAKGWSAQELHMLRDEFAKALATLEVADTDVAAVLSRFNVVTEMPNVVAQAAPEPVMVDEPVVAEPAVEKPAAAMRTKVEEPSAESTQAAGAAQSQTLRVNITVLENLMNMVSELVLTRNQLLQMLRGVGESPFAAPLQRLNQVTSELQESVMQTRIAAHRQCMVEAAAPCS